MLAEIKCGKITVGFPAEAGGLPGMVTALEGDGRETVLFGNGNWLLEAELENGLILRPFAKADNVRIYDDEDDGATHVDFINVTFKDQNGREYPEYLLTLRHEFYPDGVAFTNMVFFVRDIHSTGISRFELKAKPDFSTFDDLRWCFRERPAVIDGTLITAQTERFIEPGKDRDFKALLPMASFNLTREFAPQLYMELFMEGHSTLSNKREDAESSIKWDGLSPEISWKMQKRPFPRPIINQIRNQWGWAIKSAPTERFQPPYRMYHYFDNYERYPSDEVVAAVIAAKCDVFVMHENWRMDTQNDGVPFDAAAFEKLRDALHANNIRLAVYIRGNEESVTMRQVSWFKHLLKYNFDGLYMDYGSPYCHTLSPNELYCGGRIPFRSHYHIMRKLRQQIGPDGVFYSHTGPSFSALTMGFMSGYVSGEGERGLLIRGRKEYDYFSMSSMGIGTLWSAAFPEYASPEIVPYIASSGQYPHNNLGEQFLSSSLVHPRVPGINDQSFIPIWKLWSIVRNERNLRIVNDYNSCGVFAKNMDDGHYIFISNRGNMALAIFSNFKNETREIDTSIDFEKTGFSVDSFNKTVLLNGKAEKVSSAPEKLLLAPYGVAGILFTSPMLDANTLLQSYLAPEAPLSALGKAYLERVAEQRKLRNEVRNWKETFLRVEVPEMSPTPYEDSMTVDLFNNSFAFGYIDDKGKFNHLCWIDRNGVNQEHDGKANLYAGDSAPVIRLNDFNFKGRVQLALYSTHASGDMPFYSFCYAWLSSTADGKDAYKLEFLNDLEPDRAYLKFYCNFPE
ncbi:MAG: hypothetical protein E7054_02585 [Lentisphaerae bacterium]|nr:hypothetical protein [Lentisphaerota bacterium]